VIDKCLKDEQVPRVDERLVRVVHMIVEEYGGDVRAFIETVRGQVEVIQRAERTSHEAGAGHPGGALEH
jgi:hypothetical protein